MSSNDIVNAGLPGIVIGALLYVGAILFGPGLGPGWSDLLQGVAVLAALVLALLGIARERRVHRLHRQP